MPARCPPALPAACSVRTTPAGHTAWAGHTQGTPLSHSARVRCPACPCARPGCKRVTAKPATQARTRTSRDLGLVGSPRACRCAVKLNMLRPPPCAVPETPSSLCACTHPATPCSLLCSPSNLPPHPKDTSRAHLCAADHAGQRKRLLELAQRRCSGSLLRQWHRGQAAHGSICPAARQEDEASWAAGCRGERHLGHRNDLHCISRPGMVIGRVHIHQSAAVDLYGTCTVGLRCRAPKRSSSRAGAAGAEKGHVLRQVQLHTQRTRCVWRWQRQKQGRSEGWPSAGSEATHLAHALCGALLQGQDLHAVAQHAQHVGACQTEQPGRAGPRHLALQHRLVRLPSGQAGLPCTLAHGDSRDKSSGCTPRGDSQAAAALAP